MRSNYLKFKSINALLLSLCLCLQTVRGQDVDTSLTMQVWESIGGKANWQDAKYFMFTCVGRDNKSFTQGERTYLWNKSTGDCRFEAITTDDEKLIVLFNVGNLKGAVYLNSSKITDAQFSSQIIKEAYSEFQKDADLLFLPTFLEENAIYSLEEEKLIGTQRFTVIDLKVSKSIFGGTISGQLYVDAHTGRIEQWRPTRIANGSNEHYILEGYKDIGGGLVLPTQFTASITELDVRFPIAAALMHIEPQKFSSP